MSFEDSPFAGKLWLAPLTVGGNLPFRRLCVEFGAQVTVGEMAVARKLLKNETSEYALLKSHAEEPFFGAQLADRNPETAAEAAVIAASRGARFVDLNCGCPIDAMTGRGLGASLLRKPNKLARIVEAMRAAVEIPVTVKLRLGWREGEENIDAVARQCEEAGASAITIHGRTREQRYSRAADWDAIGRVVQARGIPVVGNGDILTHFEARDRRERSGVSSLMLARGALISPWLFREIREDRSWLPTAEERVGVLFRLLELQRDHFGVHEKGVIRTRRFMAWHMSFFHRYRPYPEDAFGARSREHPLIQQRVGAEEPVGELEWLLRDPRPETHEALAGVLIEATSHDDALERALALQATLPTRTGAVMEDAVLTPSG
jgi:tRNA-dihydrouridine synthase 3